MPYYQFTPDVYFTNFLVKRGFLHLHSDRLKVWQQLTNPNWFHLHHGLLFKDAQLFVDLLYQHFVAGSHIAIVPDYDTDGICSGTILYQSLKLFGFDHVYLYTPSMADGYGLSKKSVDDCIALAPFTIDVIITTDNGIKAFEGVQYAVDQGIRVMITDHHIGDSEKEPIADVIVNPNRQFQLDLYPFSAISGTMVIWKLMTAYASLHCSLFIQQAVFDLFIFAGLSTISDVMPLEDENRTLVQFTASYLSNREWLWQHVYEKQLPVSYRLCFLGLIVLLDTLYAAGKIDVQISSDDLGYYLSPLLNTPRRMEQTSERAFRLFNSSAFDVALVPTTMAIDETMHFDESIHFSDEQRCLYEQINKDSDSDYFNQALIAIMKHADQLYQMNQLRKEVLDSVIRQIQNHTFQQSFDALLAGTVRVLPMSHGLVGLVAGRLMNQYHLPFIVFGEAHNGCLSGSARSPELFNIYELLSKLQQQLPEAFVHWGGHAQAAGLTIRATYLDRFSEKFQALVVEAILVKYPSIDSFQEQMAHFIPKYREYFVWSDTVQTHWLTQAQHSTYDWYDMRYIDNDTLLNFVTMIRQLEPFGQGFPLPDFAFTFILSKQEYERQFKLIGKERNHAKMTLVNGANVALDCLTWRTGERLREWFDQHFATNDWLFGSVSGQLSINEFHGKCTLQLLNATFSDKF